MMNETHGERGDEVSILDLVVVLIEGWKLLLLIPLVTGVIAFSYLKLTTVPVYRSEAIMSLNPDEIALLTSARVMDASVTESGWLDRYGSMTRARSALSKSLAIEKIGEASSYYRVTLAAKDPSLAHGVLSALIQNFISASVPAGARRDQLEQELGARQEALETLRESLSKLTDLLDTTQPSLTQPTVTAADIGQSIVSLVSNIEEKRREIGTTTQALKGSVTAADIMQPPTVPDPANADVRILVVVGAALLALFFTVIFVVLRAAFLSSPGGDAKIARIKRAFWIPA